MQHHCKRQHHSKLVQKPHIQNYFALQGIVPRQLQEEPTQHHPRRQQHRRVTLLLLQRRLLRQTFREE
jgi:hypothetical protein